MSHVLRVGQPDQIAYFRAYNTDGSANTSLTASTTGLSLSVFRVGASSVSIASLSNILHCWHYGFKSSYDFLMVVAVLHVFVYLFPS